MRLDKEVGVHITDTSPSLAFFSNKNEPDNTLQLVSYVVQSFAEPFVNVLENKANLLLRSEKFYTTRIGLLAALCVSSEQTIKRRPLL